MDFVQNCFKHFVLLSKDFTKALHKAVMDHMLKPGNEKHAEAYGNVYYQAWVIADSDHKEHVEDICIQDVMYRYHVCCPLFK